MNTLHQKWLNMIHISKLYVSWNRNNYGGFMQTQWHFISNSTFPIR